MSIPKLTTKNQKGCFNPDALQLLFFKPIKYLKFYCATLGVLYQQEVQSNIPVFLNQPQLALSKHKVTTDDSFI